MTTENLQAKDNTVTELKSVRNNKRRDTVIQMFLSGAVVSEIEKVVPVSQKTIYNYINAYKEEHPELKEQSVQERCGSHTNPFRKLQNERDHYKQQYEKAAQEFNSQLSSYETQLKQQKEALLSQEQQLQEKEQLIQALEVELNSIKSQELDKKVLDLKSEVSRLKDKISKDVTLYKAMKDEFNSIIAGANVQNQKLIEENQRLRKEIEDLKIKQLEKLHNQFPPDDGFDNDFSW